MISVSGTSFPHAMTFKTKPVQTEDKRGLERAEVVLARDTLEGSLRGYLRFVLTVHVLTNLETPFRTNVSIFRNSTVKTRNK